MSFDLKLVNGDLDIANSGDLRVVENNEKLRQDVLKALITPAGGNKLHQWYGSNVSDALIGNIFDLDFAISAASEQIRSCLENLQMVQRQQSKDQNVTATESILTIKDIYINSNPKDERQIEVKVTIITGALTEMPINFTIRV